VRQNLVPTLAQLSGGIFDRFGAAPDHQYHAPGGGKVARHGEARATAKPMPRAAPVTTASF